jgi:galactitol-specific phosphotransferase system IIB component
MEDSKDTSRLTDAAEELIKAACTHVESTSLMIGQETVEGLKQLSLNSTLIEKSVESLKVSIDSKLDILNQTITDLKKEMAKDAAAQAKNRTLEWAIQNAEISSFSYYTANSQQAMTSTLFVKKSCSSFDKVRDAILMAVA